MRERAALYVSSLRVTSFPLYVSSLCVTRFPLYVSSLCVTRFPARPKVPRLGWSVNQLSLHFRSSAWTRQVHACVLVSEIPLCALFFFFVFFPFSVCVLCFHHLPAAVRCSNGRHCRKPAKKKRKKREKEVGTAQASIPLSSKHTVFGNRLYNVHAAQIMYTQRRSDGVPLVPRPPAPPALQPPPSDTRKQYHTRPPAVLASSTTRGTVRTQGTVLKTRIQHRQIARGTTQACSTQTERAAHNARGTNATREVQNARGTKRGTPQGGTKNKQKTTRTL